MFLLILDKDPYEAAYLVPHRLKFKQLLELGQLICSAGISDVFKPIKQGKELQEWVKEHQIWIAYYLDKLYSWCKLNINFSAQSIKKIEKLQKDLWKSSYSNNNYEPQTAIFRYVKEYKSFTKYDTNSELSIDIAIKEYREYTLWKEERFREALKLRSAKNEH